MTNIQRDRLSMLAAHLKSGNLGHDRFDFNAFSDGNIKPNGCRTAGCALGECLLLWPDVWTYRGGTHPFTTALEFFGLSTEEARLLFAPASPLSGSWAAATSSARPMDAPYWYRGAYVDATADEVADNIDRFLAWKPVEEPEPATIKEEELEFTAA